MKAVFYITMPIWIPVVSLGIIIGLLYQLLKAGFELADEMTHKPF